MLFLFFLDIRSYYLSLGSDLTHFYLGMITVLFHVDGAFALLIHWTKKRSVYLCNGFVCQAVTLIPLSHLMWE